MPTLQKFFARKQILIPLLIIIGVVIIYFIYVEVMRELHPKKQGMPPLTVNVMTATQEEWYDQIKATGNLSAFQGIVIKPEVSGRITKIYVGSGTYVEKGTPLIQIFPDILEAQLARNLAQLKLAELDYERGVALYRKRVISRQDLDTLTSTLQQDRAQVAQTQAQLEQNNIKAPFAGMLGLKMVDVGDYVNQGQDLIPLQQIEPIRVQFSVPEVYLSKLAMGQKVDIIPSSNPTKTESGTVYAFDSAINPSTRSMAMRAKIPNKSHILIPGGFAEVTLFAGQKHPVIVIPQTAVVYSAQGYSVYKVENNTAKQVAVTLGQRKGTNIAIQSGVNIGDIIVVAGQIKLSNGMPVKIIPDQSIKPQKTPTGLTGTGTSSPDATSTQSNPSPSKP